MASSDGKTQDGGTDSSAQCDFCKDEGLNENAVGFCSSCWKYMCSACEKGHGKFNPNHKLKKGADMPKQDVVASTFPCKIHTNYAVDMFCEVHGSVFCSLCKSLKHDSCEVQTIEEVVEEMNVKQEFDTVSASLAELSLILARQEDETRNKLVNYTKKKSEIEKKLKNLKKELVEILNLYKTILEDQQQSDMESLNSKIESYRCLHQNLEDYMKPAKESKIENDLQLFLAFVEMKHEYKIYSEFHDTLQKDIDDIGSFTLKDERLPGLIKELSEISCLEYVADGCLSVDGGHDRNIEGEFQKDQCCQIDPTMFEDSEIRKSTQACCIDKTENYNIDNLGNIEDENDEDVECGSTEEVIEKSFANIKSCSLVKEVSVGDRTSITDGCILSNGQMVLCDTGYSKLKFLDADMEGVMEVGLQKSGHIPKYVAVVDSKTIVVSITKSKLLQFICVIPEVRFGKEIALVCDCDGLAVFKKELYVYTRCLDARSSFQYEGFQILSLKGELLKTLPLFDDISCFSLNNQGNIVYIGSRIINHSKKSFMKCITREGDTVCQIKYPKSELPKSIVASERENVIFHEPASRTICVIKEDGTNKVLIKIGDEFSKFGNINRLFYNKHCESLVVVGRGYESASTHIVGLYKLEF